MSILFYKLFEKPLVKPESSPSTARVLSSEDLAMVNGGAKNEPGGNSTIFGGGNNSNKEENPL